MVDGISKVDGWVVGSKDGWDPQGVCVGKMGGWDQQDGCVDSWFKGWMGSARWMCG